VRRRLATVPPRITVLAVLVVGLALLAGGALLLTTYRASLKNDVETAARLRSRDIADAVKSGELTSTVAASRGDESLVQVVDANGVIVAASPNVDGEPTISHLRPERDEYLTTTVDHLSVGDSPYRIVARGVSVRGTIYTVYVARSLEGIDDTTANLARLLVIGFPMLLALVGTTTWIVTGRALRPVEAIRVEVEGIGAEDLHRRVPEPDTADEIGRLARTMNTMLGRLQDASERQRRFIADASHELRSPLTSIRAQLEVDLEHPERADWQTTERDVLEDAVRLQRLVDDLLLLATAQATSPDSARREPVDLDEIVLREARRLRSGSSHTIDTAAVSGAQVVGSPDELFRAIRNLLDNADRHATSTVTLGLEEQDDGVILVVRDDGPGIPTERQADIFERFTRLDDARARDSGGAGLGLAITHAVVTAHGGTITVENAPGAQFTVRLPRSPSTQRGRQPPSA